MALLLPFAFPLLAEWTPFGVPPFQDVRPAHYLPTIKKRIEAQRHEVEAIMANPQPPAFTHTIEALEYTGEWLTKVDAVLSGLQSAGTNDQLRAVDREATPLLSAPRDDIKLNAVLFARVTAVWDAREGEARGRPAEPLKNTCKRFLGRELSVEPLLRKSGLS